MKRPLSCSLSPHHFRPFFQVRKYMYQQVIHLEDVSPHYNVDGVQAYHINGKKALFIQPKPPATSGSAPAFDTVCEACNVPLRGDYSFCSLVCKVVATWQSPRRPRSPVCNGEGNGDGQACGCEEKEREDLMNVTMTGPADDPAGMTKRERDLQMVDLVKPERTIQ
jgi:hypothetical protein